ncbi:hypothetical protein HKCCE3408_04870 [Rhodobacterales bacterium HKCCE3408]|nr:hypothetical protein [Rhodobacterales bacterium HKCCE3408]
MADRQFELNARPAGTLLLQPMVLTLTDAPALDWGSGPVSLSTLRGIRLWTEKPEYTARVGRAELTFLDGPPLIVTGGARMGGPDAGQARTYRAFLDALHAAVPRDGRIEFRRGLKGGSPARGWTTFAIIAVIDLALLIWLWGAMREDAHALVRPGLILFALLGLCLAAGAGQAMAGRSYDPRSIPRDLVP